MKLLIALLLTLFIQTTATAQTNVYNFYNSQITINSSSSTPQAIQSVYSQKMIVLPQYYIERLRWENMLEQRRNAAFRMYLRRYRR